MVKHQMDKNQIDKAPNFKHSSIKKQKQQSF